MPQKVVSSKALVPLHAETSNQFLTDVHIKNTHRAYNFRTNEQSSGLHIMQCPLLHFIKILKEKIRAAKVND